MLHNVNCAKQSQLKTSDDFDPYARQRARALRDLRRRVRKASGEKPDLSPLKVFLRK